MNSTFVKMGKTNPDFPNNWYQSQGSAEYAVVAVLSDNFLIEMINFLISVRRKAYLDTLQLEILCSRMGWQNA